MTQASILGIHIDIYIVQDRLVTDGRPFRGFDKYTYFVIFEYKLSFQIV